MNIDRPGFETLPSDRIALGAAILETDRAALGFDEDFVAGSGFPAGEEDFFAERVFDGSRGDVRVAGRFLFSGMPLEIIPSVGGCDQRTSAPFTVELHAPTADGEDPKMR